MSPNHTRQTLALCFAASTAISGAALVQIELDLLPAVGGQLSDDNGDGIIDRAEPAEIYMIGGASGVPSGNRNYQASYEFSLRDPSLIALGTGEIVSVLLTIRRNEAVRLAGGPPALTADLGGYIGDGVFDTTDAGQGMPIGMFTIYNNRIIPWTPDDSKIEVTSFFISQRDEGHDYIGFNLRMRNIPNGTDVLNSFFAPRLEITALIPEPSTSALAALGLLGLALRRKRG